MIFKFYLNFEYNTDIEQRGKKWKFHSQTQMMNWWK